MRNFLRRFLPVSLYGFLAGLRAKLSVRRGYNRRTVYISKYLGDTDQRKRFLSEMANLDMRESYIKLVRGLDDESARTVCRILARVRLMADTGFARMPLFDEEEERQIIAMQKNFTQNVIQIDKECYAYLNYLLPINNFEPNVFYYHHEMRLLKTLESVGEKAVVDVGGYIGDSALVFSRYFKGTIYTFEPIEENYQNLLKTIALNKAERIIPVKLGLSSEARTASFQVARAGGSSGEHALTTDLQGTQTVELTTLDAFAAEQGLSVGLIKVDIEGAEQDFLKGAENTIKTQKPILILSIYHNAYDFFQIKPLIESWDLGYTFQISKPADGHLLTEIVLLAEVK